MNPFLTLVRTHPEIALSAISIALGLVAAAWIGHTERSRAVAICIRQSVASLGWTLEYVAGVMGISPEELNHQLAGRKPLHLYRLAELPDDFQAEFDRKRAALRGAVVLESGSVVVLRSPEEKVSA